MWPTRHGANQLSYNSEAMDETVEALGLQLEQALDHVVRAVGEIIPQPNDVFDPHGLVRRWVAGLEAEPRGRFLGLLLSDQWEAQLGAIARAVLVGAHVWPSPTATASTAADSRDSA